MSALIRLRKDDFVKIISGKNKGKTGKILKISGSDIFVEGVNVITKNLTKRVKLANQSVESTKSIHKPLHVSKVSLFNQELNACMRISYRFEDRKKIRFNAKNNKVI